MLGDSVTTDHISPAGSIKKDGPAGKYLIAHGVDPKDFNCYGARRGNHEVMVRGTFANVRLRNLLAPGTEGGVTRHLPDGEVMSIFDASEKYAAEDVPLVVLAGKEYGSGSSRDWAAKGPRLLGVRAVIAESYERIHRSNLVGMGILPLQFAAGETAASLGLTGEEIFETVGLPALLASGFSAAASSPCARVGQHRSRRSRRSCASTRRRRSPTTSTAASCTTCCGSWPARLHLSIQCPRDPSVRLPSDEPSSRRFASPGGSRQAAPQMIDVVGGSALGPGRLQKRLTAIRRTNPGARALNGNYLHFADIDGTLTEDETRVLHALLTYGPRPVDESAGRATVASGRRLMVVPRLGTISPWSSKATDIAHVCGLRRCVVSSAPSATSSSGEIVDEVGFVRVLANGMTESVLERPSDAARLFERPAPRALGRVALGPDGRAALARGKPRAGAGALARRDRLPLRRLPDDGARSDRRRADDVRPGEQRALPPQDLQRRLRGRRREAGRRPCSR